LQFELTLSGDQSPPERRIFHPEFDAAAGSA
jgi:hypothetical protein